MKSNNFSPIIFDSFHRAIYFGVETGAFFDVILKDQFTNEYMYLLGGNVSLTIHLF